MITAIFISWGNDEKVFHTSKLVTYIVNGIMVISAICFAIPIFNVIRIQYREIKRLIKELKK